MPLRIMSLCKIMTALSLVALSACTSVFEDVRHTWHYATTPAKDAHLSTDDIAQFPYTAMYVQSEGEARALVVLAFIDDESVWQDVRLTNLPSQQLTWATANDEQLLTRHGRVVRSYGLDLNVNLVGPQLAQDPLQCVQQHLNVAGHAVRPPSASLNQVDNCREPWRFHLDVIRNEQHANITRQLSRQPAQAFQRFELEAQLLPQRVVTVELPLGSVPALLVHEKVSVLHGIGIDSGNLWRGDNSKWVNRYWLAMDGHVLKSEQQMAPGMRPMTMTQVKWVGRNDHE